MQDIAIQSFCYRHFKAMPAFIEQLNSTGVHSTELCGIHATFSEPDKFDEAIQPLRRAGVKLVAIGVERMTGHRAVDEPRFRFCKAAGVKTMSISFQPEAMFDALRNVERLADEYDVNLGIHNHGGYDWLGNSTILKYIFSRTSKRIGLYLDTAWAVDAKQDPTKMAEQFADRLYGVHLKDFIYDRSRKGEDVIIGEGNLNLPELMAVLKNAQFNGPLVIEYEGDPQDPVPALKRCVDAVAKLV